MLAGIPCRYIYMYRRPYNQDLNALKHADISHVCVSGLRTSRNFVDYPTQRAQKYRNVDKLKALEISQKLLSNLAGLFGASTPASKGGPNVEVFPFADRRGPKSLEPGAYIYREFSDSVTHILFLLLEAHVLVESVHDTIFVSSSYIYSFLSPVPKEGGFVAADDADQWRLVLI